MKITNQHVIDKAKELGFSLIGFSPAEELDKEVGNLKEWLGKSYQAGMKYMEENLEKRLDVKKILPGAKSVISLGMNYYKDDEFNVVPNIGKVSRYAWGKDYHFVIWEKMEELVDYLKEIDGSFTAKCYVDTGPVMDKVWAVRGGIGWLGKHSNVINKNFGSWLFLAAIITNQKFQYSTPIPDFCGSCTACIDACPTNAIVKDYVVDANKCISYLTIENKKEIPDSFSGKFEQWVFGCDICQDVCPWNNKFFQESTISEFNPVNKELNLTEIIEMTNSQFRQRFEISPINRARLKGLKRNALFLLKDAD